MKILCCSDLGFKTERFPLSFAEVKEEEQKSTEIRNSHDQKPYQHFREIILASDDSLALVVAPVLECCLSVA